MRRLLLLIGLLYTVGCTSKSDTTPVSDTALEATTLDSRPALDAAIDSATSDTPSDIGVVFDEEFFKGRGEWEGPPGSACLTVSKNPDLAAPPLVWAECGVGCKQLVPDWSPRPGLKRFAVQNGVPTLKFREGVPHVRFVRGRVKAPLNTADTLLPTVTNLATGRSVAASRIGGVCGAIVTVGAAGFGYVDSNDGSYTFASQPIGGKIAWHTCDAVCRGGSSRDIHMLKNALAIETYPPSGATAFDLKSFERRRLKSGLQFGVQSLDERSLIGMDASKAPIQGVVYEDFDTGLSETIIQPEPGRGVLGVVVDPSTSTIVWAETATDFGSTTDPRLFVSPYSKTAAGIKRKHIASWTEVEPFLGATTSMIAYKGMLVALASDTEIRLIRLTDGATWVIKPPIAGITFRKPIYVDDNEVWVEIDEGNYKGPSGALRIARSTLGEPIPGKP